MRLAVKILCHLTALRQIRLMEFFLLTVFDVEPYYRDHLTVINIEVLVLSIEHLNYAH